MYMYMYIHIVHVCVGVCGENAGEECVETLSGQMELSEFTVTPGGEHFYLMPC